ncbi:MAG TPA: hypothetical protein VJ124_04850 [Pyrinomonadaceae bacterium]|nr:hypothetical protein [Pyrinomonadaceae bacterium]
MNRLLMLAFLTATMALSVVGQGKGVDKQSERVRDTGASRTPASNGAKTDVGTGRGIDFGKGRTPEVLPIPNPSRIVARRDAIIKVIQAVMRDRGLILDEGASRLAEGIVVSQPYTFIKGAVVSQSELSRYADTESSTVRGWTRGRYTLTVEVQPIDGSSANVSVNAKVEGRTDGATGAEWVSLTSLGLAEEEFLCSLITNLTGVPPGGRSQCVG